MALRRSVTTRAKQLYLQQRVVLPLSHSHRGDDDHEDSTRYDRISKTPNFLQRRPFGTGYALDSFSRSRNLLQGHGSAIPAVWSPVFARNMSSFGEGSAEKIEIMTDVAEVLGDKAAEAASQVAPVVNEVAIAAADSFFPVAALQYLIDYVHIYTGCNWWASIVLTTVLIRTLQLPLMIHQIKATSKFTLLRPQLEEIKEEMQSRDMSPAALAEGQARMKALFNEYGVTPFTPLKGMFIVGPVFLCFFLAITNMAEKVQSFKEGGALWFTDLATPDPLYILPILTALTFWITVECNAQEGLEGNPSAGTIKNVSRVFAALAIPLTATFPKAIFCYWITSNLFSLTYGLVLKSPEMKKRLGIPIIQVPPPSPDQKPPLSFFEVLKKYAAAQQMQSLPSSPPPDASSKPANHQRIQSSSKPANHQRIQSSSVLRQRIKSLEKEVKGRGEKGKKR